MGPADISKKKLQERMVQVQEEKFSFCERVMSKGAVEGKVVPLSQAQDMFYTMKIAQMGILIEELTKKGSGNGGLKIVT